jgi:hypothetical protein
VLHTEDIKCYHMHWYNAVIFHNIILRELYLFLIKLLLNSYSLPTLIRAETLNGDGRSAIFIQVAFILTEITVFYNKDYCIEHPGIILDAVVKSKRNTLI